jgi:hypothetical protein
LALEGMIIKDFWQHGDKDYRKFEYGMPLVLKTCSSKASVDHVEIT